MIIINFMINSFFLINGFDQIADIILVQVKTYARNHQFLQKWTNPHIWYIAIQNKKMWNNDRSPRHNVGDKFYLFDDAANKRPKPIKMEPLARLTTLMRLCPVSHALALWAIRA